MALATLCPLAASEQDALGISNVIRLRHMPYGTILDPVFATASSDQVVSYSRCGDSAIWTGHYLAAEAFRYNVTRTSEALGNIRATLSGLRSLVDITGTDLLARCLVPVGSPYAAAITQEEAPNGVHLSSLNGVPHYWIGRTSRDQYCGVFFGLAVAYDLVDDAGVRADISALATRLLDFLLENDWNVRMPDGSISTTFSGRPDQQLTLLQIGRHVNARQFEFTYGVYRFLSAVLVGIPIAAEALDDHGSYFKFNLDTVNFYSLLRLEDSLYKAPYDQAYDLLRRTTEDHQNAHFNMIDRALRGANEVRDANTRAYLRDWLLRPRRGPYVDLRGRYPACGSDRACAPLAIVDRVPTDFLWQRSPFLLFGGGEGRIEGAGIDYILPYWMGRYYGVISGGPQPPVALSVKPSSGSGSGATYRFSIWDPNGYADIRAGLIVINSVLSASGSCYLYYDRALRSVWLANDSGSGWFGPSALGSPVLLRNSQCTVDPLRSSDAGAGEILTLDLTVSFPPGAGLKNTYLYAQDAAGLGTGWQRLGAWTAP